jgi:TonB-dependent receptor
MPVADEDGDSRTLAFDIFPTELIEYIVVSKALTPDIEADAIGGSINFITKTAPEERLVNAKIGGGFNAQAQKPLYDIAFTYGDRISKGKFGYLLSASLYNRAWATDNYEVIYGSNFNHGINRLELRDYIGKRQTVGLNASADYKINDDVNFYFKAVHGRMNDDEWNRKMMFRYATGTGATLELQNIHNIMEMRFWGGELGGKLILTNKKKLNITWKASTYSNRFGYGPVPFSRGDSRNGYHVVRFHKTNVVYLDQVYDPVSSLKLKLIGTDQVGMQYIDFINHPFFGEIEFPNPDSLAGMGDSPDNIQPIMRDPVSLSEIEFNEAYSELNAAYEQDPIIGQIDLEYKFSNKFVLKGGFKTRFKFGERSRGIHTWSQNINNPSSSGSFPISNFNADIVNTNGGFLQELDNPYQSFWDSLPFLSTNGIDQFVDIMDSNLIENESITIELRRAAAGGSFRYNENIHATYIMGSYQLGNKLNITAGVRFENTTLKMNADSIISTIDSTSGAVQLYIEKVFSNYSYLNYFPSIHLRYSPLKNINIRFSAGKSMRRPNFNETKPGSPVWLYTNQVLEYGNPRLKPSYAWNFDLTFEYFFKNIGLASIGSFYKRVEGHIFSTNNPLLSQQIGTLVGTIVRSYENADISHVAGIETNIVRRLDFLPSFLSGFGLNANYSFIYSNMKVPGRDTKQPLPRQANQLFNTAIFYEKYGLVARIALNYRGPFLMELNTYPEDAADPNNIRLLHQNTDYDIFMDEIWSLDASFSYRFNKYLTAYAEFNNLLNAPYRIYRGSRAHPVQTEYYSLRGQLGIKFQLPNKDNSNNKKIE